MRGPIGSRKCLVLMLVLLVFGTHGISYGQAPRVVASTESPLTEATLSGGRVALLLTGGKYARNTSDVRDAVTVSGIAGVTVDRNDIVRVGETAVTVELQFSGDLATNGTLTFTVGAGAIENYEGPALTAEIPVTATAESLVASTVYPLTEAALNGSVVTLTMTGRSYVQNISDIRDAVTVSGITGVTFDSHSDIRRVSDTEMTVVLTFLGDLVGGMTTDGTLTFTVGAEAVAAYEGPAFTAEIPVAAGAGDATLSGLTVSPVDIIGFASDVTAYTYQRAVYEADQVTVMPTANDANATIDVNGTAVPSGSSHTVAPLSEGKNDITITVTAYDGQTETYTVTVTAYRRVTTAYAWNPIADFNTLGAAGNTSPTGLWSDGATMWVMDGLHNATSGDGKIYAYDMTTKTRVPTRDFNTLDAAGNDSPTGLWSDGTTMWVAEDSDGGSNKIYAYDMTTKTRVPTRDFNTLDAAENYRPRGIWSDGTTMWVADDYYDKIYAYDMTTNSRVPAKDFNTLRRARNIRPYGLWSDGATMWVADWIDEKLYAYNMTTKARDAAKDFNTLKAARMHSPTGLWSDGTTMWVADETDGWASVSIYAFNIPSNDATPDLVVQSPSVSDSSPDAGATFTLSATVRNQGTGSSASTTLHYYRSSDATISTGDTEMESHTVSGLAASDSSDHSLDLTAPSSSGTYHYGACVKAVLGESNTGNNCSPAVAVTVAGENTSVPRGQKTADFNGDGIVNFADFFDFVDAFGTTDAKFDLDGSGTVDFADFFEFVDAFGT